jgi:hypothetical protein
MIGIVFLSIFSTGALMIISMMLSRAFGSTPWDSTGGNYFFHASMITLIFAPIIWGLVWFLKKESFTYTHYPIRFNRRSRKVHFFETDGNVSSVEWDDVYFTLAQVDNVHKFWNIFGHVLDNNRSTVLKSFALSFKGTGDPEGISLMKSHWEFVRRYMEDGPEEVSEQVQYCLPISETRESFLFGVRRLLANNSGAPKLLLPFILTSMIFDIVTVPFRYFAIQTSKIPQWPARVEEESHVEVGDPYAIVGMSDGKRKAVFPGATEETRFNFSSPANRESDINS